MKLHAPWDVLARMAEFMRIKVPIKVPSSLLVFLFIMMITLIARSSQIMLTSWQKMYKHKGNIPNIKAKKTDPVQKNSSHIAITQYYNWQI